MQSFIIILLFFIINTVNGYQTLNSTNKFFPSIQYHTFVGNDWKPTNLVPCSPKVMIAVDGACTNKYLEVVKDFLVNQMFADHNFNLPHKRLGISRFFTGHDWYKMGAVWGDFSHMQHVRDFIRSWPHEPETHTVLYNAILDLSKSWIEPNENGKVSFIIFTSTIDEKTIRDAKPYLDVLKRRGHLTIVTLGNTEPFRQLPPSIGTHIKWNNPERDAMMPSWRSMFWQQVYKCRNQPKKSCTCNNNNNSSPYVNNN